jgi:hypothetical protein
MQGYKWTLHMPQTGKEYAGDKKFWEEIIVYFLLIGHGQQKTENWNTKAACCQYQQGRHTNIQITMRANKPKKYGRVGGGGGHRHLHSKEMEL